MKRLIRLALLSILLAAPFLYTGCESAPERERGVSSIPWNRPQKWEGQGQLGGMSGMQGQ